MKVLGLDPGFHRLGYAILEGGKTPKILQSGLIETSPEDSMSKRLGELYNSLKIIIQKQKPNVIALEEIYLSRNSKTALGVAMARGVLICLAGQFDIPVFEYYPNKIKSAVIGYGKAQKHQVKYMINQLFKMPSDGIKHDDEYDAIAVALCHLLARRWV